MRYEKYCLKTWLGSGREESPVERRIRFPRWFTTTPPPPPGSPLSKILRHHVVKENYQLCEQVDSLLLRLHLLSPDPAHKPVGAVENLDRFRKEIICFFCFHNLFTIETITHLHIKYLNLNTFKISTYEKNVIFPPGK